MAIIKGFIMDPLFQLRSRLEIHCMNSSKNLMFPQYLRVCHHPRYCHCQHFITSVIIRFTAQSSAWEQAEPQLTWKQTKKWNLQNHAQGLSEWKGGAEDLNLDQKWSKPWLRLKCYHINNGTVSPSPEADGTVTTLPRDQNPIRDFGYCRALMINPEKRETSWPH